VDTRHGEGGGNFRSSYCVSDLSGGWHGAVAEWLSD